MTLGHFTRRPAGNRDETPMVMSFLGKGGKSRTSDGGANSTGGSGGPRFAMLAEVRAYWEGLREGGALPQRDQIDPRGIVGALENTFLLERVASGIGRFRLAGMQVHDLMGMDVRGMPLSAIFEPVARARLSDGLETVFNGPAVLEMWLEAERGIGRPTLEGRMIVLPLTGPNGEADLALGCLAMEGAVGRAPRRFAISGLMSEVMAPRARPQMPAIAPSLPAKPLIAVQPARQLAAGFAEQSGAFRGDFTPRPPRGKPNLKLVHSRD